jgi:hypothetical protein
MPHLPKAFQPRVVGRLYFFTYFYGIGYQLQQEEYLSNRKKRECPERTNSLLSLHYLTINY